MYKVSASTSRQLIPPLIEVLMNGNTFNKLRDIPWRLSTVRELTIASDGSYCLKRITMECIHVSGSGISPQLNDVDSGVQLWLVSLSDKGQRCRN